MMNETTATATYPEWKGETYSYTDARKRRPDAWKINVVRGTYGDGQTWEREEVEDAAPKGLGTWARMGQTWIYIEPNGYARPVRENYGKSEPPPLPRPESERGTCGCKLVPGGNGYKYDRKATGQHNCGACGQPFWVELHGVADGFCTYCYRAG